MGRTLQEHIKAIQTGYSPSRERELPKNCYRFGRKGYVYFRRAHFTYRLPEPDEPEFWSQYRKALERAPRSVKRPPPELFTGTGFNVHDLHVSETNLMHGAKRRARRAGRTFNLPEGWVVEAYLKQKGKCALSGRKMRKPLEQWDPFGPSIDRICSDGGYTPENCHLTTLAVNHGKNGLSMDDYVSLCRSVVRHTDHKKAKARKA